MLLFVSVVLAASTGLDPQAIDSRLAAGFGSFAFTNRHELPLFSVEPESFSVRGSDTSFRLGPPRTGFVVTRQTRFEKTLSIRPEPGSPMRIIYEPTSGGFSLEYRDGLVIRGEGPPPFITWDEGTVGVGLPSAPTRWALLSWQDPHPPILVAFADEPVGLIAHREEGGFRIESVSRSPGWVRVRAPLGLEAVATATAADLGALARRIEPHLEPLLQPAARLLNVEMHEDGRVLTITWRFDRPGALLPEPLSRLRPSDPVQLLSPTTETPWGRISASLEVRVRCVIQRLTPGVAVVRAKPFTDVVSEVDGQSALSVAAAALEWLNGSAHMRLGERLAQANARFRQSIVAEREPVSGIRIGFGRTGEGSALLAAHCLAAEAQGLQTPWLDGLLDGIDWNTWLPPGLTDEEQATAAAIVAVAAALRSSPEERALGAMAQAALYARRADAPFSLLRSWLYPHPGRLMVAQPAWLQALRSPVRVLTPGVDTQASADEIILQGQARSLLPIKVTLLTDSPLGVVGKFNATAADVENAGDSAVITVVPQSQANWLVKLSRQPDPPLPLAASLRYSEDQR